MDAVMLLPGIMGSELRRRSDDSVLWGMSWRTASDGHLPWRSHQELAVTDEDLTSGGRIYAADLLRCRALFPFWSKQPYTAIERRLRDAVGDRRALKPFPYDWRLPVDLNAKRFAQEATDHLERWRSAHLNAGDVQLTLVAHSMGGLVAWQAIQKFGLKNVRSLVTLGTPFGGSLNAFRILAEGDDAATTPGLTTLRAARDLARTCPSVYDLLPSNPCARQGASLRALTTADVAAVNASRALAQAAALRRPVTNINAAHVLVSMSMLVGVGQSTDAVLPIDDLGNFRFADFEQGSGDGTVLEVNALAEGRPAMRIPQSHENLARSIEGINFACARVLGHDIGEPLALPGLDVSMDDCQMAGVVSLRVRQEEVTVPTRVTSSLDGDLATTTWTPRLQDKTYVYTAELPPGLHEVSVGQGGFSPLTRLLWVEGD